MASTLAPISSCLLLPSLSLLNYFVACSKAPRRREREREAFSVLTPDSSPSLMRELRERATEREKK